MEEETGKSPSEEPEGTPSEAVDAAASDQAAVAETTPEEAPVNHIAQRRGRMVSAGIAAALIVSAVAVIVAAIFQLTATWFVTCPTDLPVNDPARVLWSQVVADRVADQPLGVSEKVAGLTQWKRTEPAAESPKPEPKRGQ